VIDLLNILQSLKLPILMPCEKDLKLNLLYHHFMPLLDRISTDAVLSDNLINLFQQMVGCLHHLATQTRPELKIFCKST